MNPSVWLIEDDPYMGESLVERFRLEGFEVAWDQTLAEAARRQEVSAFDLIVSDYLLPDGNIERWLDEVHRKSAPLPPIVVITGHATVERAVRLMHAGIADYLVKPFDLAALIERARTLAGSRALALGTTLGVSSAMQEIERVLCTIARRRPTVLITGESGSGKEVVARRLHALTAAGEQRPFVAVNCAAIAESLAESLFFGHERGAFTGADRLHRGYFEQASGGTLFLDEIAELPLAMQAKLLRVLEERRLYRIGGERPVAIEAQLVFATHQPLEEWVRGGRFREDLFHRINLVRLHVPPLRERRDDILWLAEGFLREQPAPGGGTWRLTPDARVALLSYDWPGNVRELRNRITRACLMARSPVLTRAALFADAVATRPQAFSEALPTLGTLVEATERDYIRFMLERHHGRIGEAARALGISRKTLWERCRRWNLHAVDSVDATG
ncbi:MAG: sigma-54 dependent transcriptional regulator [Casimicrobiaceae bacterium]|nr:sigma-54 dependent transcriptional regulator [Casimicrobiaceae bacterium]MCX8098101.1 sigma-54 dependent transcriptional regulator [Casimicrobiaceae bacterium]MDW8311639.1 sigma-54 dependent transcriptional regulator [Burkholderiales bacterium]